jgi:aminoglycoside phosphotransferase family enzyme/predicted kinase
MEKLEIIKNIKNPKFFGSDVKSVDIIQTHISYVALTGKYAYKIKKQVNYGFLDFSTVEKRKYYCEEEMRLNRRLCPDIYLDVIPITKKNRSLELNGDGEIVDYALKMREFSQENIMTNLLTQGKIDEEKIEKICDVLVNFYNSEEHSKEADRYGELEAVKRNICENFEQTESMIDITLPKGTYEYIKNTSSKFFKKKQDIFKKRIKNKNIKNCHGDLHSGNIVVTDEKIYIFDCIEFNKRFRYCDTASDIGFLAMDLDYMNYPYLSSYLIRKYIEKSKDFDILEILNFYKSYRAYVRGKVIGFRLNALNISNDEKNDIINTTKKYFDLSEYYARLFSLDINNNKPLIFIVGGLTGVGKSTLSLKISVDYHAYLINTDVIRKELAGINIFERHHDEVNTGLYTPERIDQTYDKVIQKTEYILKKGKNVVLDATFQKKKYRDMARRITKENNAILIPILCVCPEEIVRKWLERRIKTKTVSDGRWEIYINQKKTFQPFTSDENYIIADLSKNLYEERIDLFKKILTKVNKGVK